MRLHDHDGACSRYHGYNFALTLSFSVPLAASIALDVVDIDTWVHSEIIAVLHNTDLTGVVAYPSLEGILIWIANKAFANFDVLENIRLVGGERYFSDLGREEWCRAKQQP